jgi:hypothetical protein
LHALAESCAMERRELTMTSFRTGRNSLLAFAGPTARATRTVLPMVTCDAPAPISKRCFVAVQRW